MTVFIQGLQAARSADVAISQFRFLKKLLLVHGAWSYRRLSKLILCKCMVNLDHHRLRFTLDSFYKNIVLYMTQFWVCIEDLYLSVYELNSYQYSFFNNFSGQIAYESWTLSLYNVVFTVLPPLVIGIFDQFVSARILDRYPQLYILGQRNEFFTKTAFWLWVANALYHSLVRYLFIFNLIGVCLTPSPDFIWFLCDLVLGRPQVVRWFCQWSLVLGDDSVPRCTPDCAGQGCADL